MKITIQNSSGRCYCRHHQCKKNPEYIDEYSRIKRGTICARILIYGVGHGFYCRDCIDLILIEARKMLNPQLWSFS